MKNRIENLIFLILPLNITILLIFMTEIFKSPLPSIAIGIPLSILIINPQNWSHLASNKIFKTTILTSIFIGIPAGAYAVLNLLEIKMHLIFKNQISENLLNETATLAAVWFFLSSHCISQFLDAKGNTVMSDQKLYYAKMPPERGSKSASKEYPFQPWTRATLLSYAKRGKHVNCIEIVKADLQRAIANESPTVIVKEAEDNDINGIASYSITTRDHIKRRCISVKKEIAQRLHPKLFET